MPRRRHISRSVSSIDRGARTVLLIILMIMSGWIMAVASGTSFLSYLAWVGLLPIFIAIRSSKPRLALFYGAVWGISHYFFSTESSSAISMTAVVSLMLLIIIPAAYTYFGACLTRRFGYMPLVLAVGWILVELALQPVTTQSGLLANSLADSSVMRIVGGALGYVFVAFLIVYVNARLISLVSKVNFVVSCVLPMEIEERRCGLIENKKLTHTTGSLFSYSQPRAPPQII